MGRGDDGAPVEVPLSGEDALAARIWAPSASADRRIMAVVAPALGVRQELYASFAAHLASRGISALTFDYRAVGASLGDAPVRDSEGDLRDWGDGDVRAVLDWVRRGRETASEFVVYLGHSMGTPLLGPADVGEAVDAVVAVAAPHAHWRHWTGPARLRMWFNWHLLVPLSTRLLGYFPGRALGLGADLPAGVALQWARWARHRDYLVGEEGRVVRRGFEELRVPLLAVSSREDPYSPPGAVASLLRFFGNARVEHRTVEGRDFGLESLGHLDFFRDPPGPALWDELIDWVLTVLPDQRASRSALADR